jgi:Holliday junction resolvase RusA-like endonuclease
MIYFCLPFIPPTVNHAYINIRKKVGSRVITQRVLSPEGRKFKKDTEIFLLQKVGFDRKADDIGPNHKVGLAITFQFPELACKGWPTKAKSKYKKVDLSNRVKLLEDSLVTVTGIDDSCFFTLILRKVEGEEATHIWMWDEDKEPDGATRAICRTEKMQ